MIYDYFQRMDIGECSKLHDVALKADYEKKSQRREYYFEFDVSFLFFSKF